MGRAHTIRNCDPSPAQRDRDHGVIRFGARNEVPCSHPSMTTREPAPQQRSKPRVSLRIKLGVGLTLIIVMLFSAINGWNIWQHRKSRLRDAASSARAIVSIVASTLVSELANSSLDSERLKTMVRNIGRTHAQMSADDRTLAYLLVTDPTKRVIAGFAQPSLVVFPGDQTLPDEAQVLANVAKLEGNLGGFMRARSFNFTVPATGEQGRLLVGTSLAQVERETTRDLVINIAVLVVSVVALFVYASATLGRLVIAPLDMMMKSMRRLRDGDLNTRLDLVDRTDEIGILADTYNFMVLGLSERERLKDAFNRYVSKQVYKRLEAGEITLTGENREATILFSDIRSFTALSEQLTPPDVVAMLNEYFNEMVEIVFRYDGFLNKFIGDALMAVYNAPLEQSEPELRAVRTALEMLEALHKLNGVRSSRGQFPLRIGIGVNTGPVVAGNIGHEQRLEYTVIGDAVNLAQRIESQTKVTGSSLLISESTYNKVAQHVIAEPLPAVKMKGKQEAVALYAVTGLRQPPGQPGR